MDSTLPPDHEGIARGRSRSSGWAGLTLALILLSPLATSACGATPSTTVTISQSTDAPLSSGQKGQLAPGAVVGITVSIRNTGAGPARGLTVEDVLPTGFRFQQLTTVGGNAIRTAISDPSGTGNPRWGTWTIPAGSGNTISELVISFTAQAGQTPGNYVNQVKLDTSSTTEVQQGDPVTLVVIPRPALTLSAQPVTSQVSTGSTVNYLLSVSNVGSAIARGVAVSVTLPPGFLYVNTTGFDGNAVRISSVDPPGNSLLPLWSSWNIPAATSSGAGLLRITFQARVLPAVSPGQYSLTAGLTSSQDLGPQTVGGLATVQVLKGTTPPLLMTVAPTALFVPQNGSVTYVITVENDSTVAAQAVTVTDTLPQGFSYARTNSITVNGRAVGSRMQPTAGSATPAWGAFTIPGGGFNGATLVITFTASIGNTTLGSHPNVVSGNSANGQVTGASDLSPVTVTAP
jgi:uncharacterized repeat protein (TIGR01451 family)